MTGRRRGSESERLSSAMDAALDAVDVAELRGLIRYIIPWLDEPTYARLANELVDRAARNPSGWSPEGPTDAEVSEIVAFAEAARRVGYAEPSEVDDYLRQGSSAFLGKDYPTAFRIFRALLPPIGNADIDLGQHETVYEVLGVDAGDCAIQYMVCVYMTATPPNRAKAVLAAMDDVRAVGRFWEPLAEMERAAVEPLPGFAEFLPRWRALVEQRIPRKRRSDWDTEEDRWLREVIGRMEGAGGLATLGRSTKRADDLSAWCRTLVEQKDWKRALQAYEEAANLVADEAHRRAGFLDGAALAAHELGRKDLPSLLERAWRVSPSMVRLRRWLGAAGSKAVVRERSRAALEACPKEARRQRAFLHVLLGDPVSAAKLLASAPGLGWSDAEHPGPLAFPLFSGLLGGGGRAAALGHDTDEANSSLKRDQSGLSTPEIATLLDLAGVTNPGEGKARTAMFSAMRNAAERRIQGVTGTKRRRHYGHAAALALACGQIDPTPEGRHWLATLRHTYRRYPALQRELSGAGGVD